MRFMSVWAIAAIDPYSTDTAAQIARAGASLAQASGKSCSPKRSSP
jgi:hypothetical protein